MATFDPQKHPRNTRGEFAHHLGELAAGGGVELPGGTKVDKFVSGFRVTHGGERVGVHDTPQQAADAALEASAKSPHPESLGGKSFRDLPAALKANRAKARRAAKSGKPKDVPNPTRLPSSRPSNPFEDKQSKRSSKPSPTVRQRKPHESASDYTRRISETEKQHKIVNTPKFAKGDKVSLKGANKHGEITKVTRNEQGNLVHHVKFNDGSSHQLYAPDLTKTPAKKPVVPEADRAAAKAALRERDVHMPEVRARLAETHHPNHAKATPGEIRRGPTPLNSLLPAEHAIREHKGKSHSKEQAAHYDKLAQLAPDKASRSHWQQEAERHRQVAGVKTEDLKAWEDRRQELLKKTNDANHAFMAAKGTPNEGRARAARDIAKQNYDAHANSMPAANDRASEDTSKRTANAIGRAFAGNPRHKRDLAQHEKAVAARTGGGDKPREGNVQRAANRRKQGMGYQESRPSLAEEDALRARGEDPNDARALQALRDEHKLNRASGQFNAHSDETKRADYGKAIQRMGVGESTTIAGKKVKRVSNDAWVIDSKHYQGPPNRVAEHAGLTKGEAAPKQTGMNTGAAKSGERTIRGGKAVREGLARAMRTKPEDLPMVTPSGVLSHKEGETFAQRRDRLQQALKHAPDHAKPQIEGELEHIRRSIVDFPQGKSSTAAAKSTATQSNKGEIAKVTRSDKIRLRKEVNGGRRVVYGHPTKHAGTVVSKDGRHEAQDRTGKKISTHDTVQEAAQAVVAHHKRGQSARG